MIGNTKKTKSAFVPHSAKYLNNNDPWMLAEDIPDIDFQFSQIWLSAFVNNLQKTVGINYKKILCVYHGYNLKFYYGINDSDDFAKHLLSLIVDNPAFGERINKEIRHYSTKLKKFIATVSPEKLTTLSGKKLADLCLKLDKLHTTLYTWGWLPNAVDMFHGNFTNYLREQLEKKLGAEGVNAALVSLSVSPEKSVIDQEQDSFLNLVALKQSGKNKELTEKLKKHTAKYFYLKHLWLGKEGVYDRAYYQSEIDKFIKSGQKAKKIILEKEKKRQEILAERKSLIKKLRLNKKLIKIFSIYSEFAVTKVFRRDAQLFWAYKMDFIFAELSKRFGLPIVNVRFMFTEEINQALRNGTVERKSINELKQRIKFCVYYAEKGVDFLLVGKQAEKLAESVKANQDQEVKEIKGQVACLGRVTGLVRIVNSVGDMKKLAKGEILVSIATNPDIVPAMKKAAAIITEQGGITSHAAIVSRELNIPCIIGTKIATQVLKDGDLVEVDAEKGIVKIIKSRKT